VGIVGGGPGGTYVAYKLSATLGDKVCLFEKEAELGGRMTDESFDNGATRVGTGARRVMENQKFLFDLAKELGITLETPETGTDLIQARNRFAYSKDAFVTAYPTMKPKTDPEVDHETWLYDQLRLGPQRAKAAEYSDFREYIRAVVGNEEFEFLRDMSRFRADFDYPLSAKGYLDYLDEEWDTCCTPSYPVGGMSSFIRGMESKAVEAKVRVFKAQPVESITRSGSRYRLKTPGHLAEVTKLVIAAPPAGFDAVTGEVADAIKTQAPYKALTPIRVVVINQQWDTAWWKEVKNPAVTTGESHTWRAWTTEHCLNFVEMPLEPYATAQKVIRSVYNDDPKCTEFWETLRDQGGIEKVEAEVVRGLSKLLSGNGVSSPATVDIPKPKKTTMHVWPGAWYFLSAGTTVNAADVPTWALEPIAGDANVSLVGEAYWPTRSGWSEGAYKSANRLLSTKYGLAGLETMSREPKVMSKRRHRSEGGH
jgi:hypothetical protein